MNMWVLMGKGCILTLVHNIQNFIVKLAEKKWKVMILRQTKTKRDSDVESLSNEDYEIHDTKEMVKDSVPLASSYA